MGDLEELPRVLVVDDDVDHATMLEVALESRGYHVLTAHSCRQAKASLAANEVDAVISDLTLGDGTALDLLRGAGARRPRVAVVLSGFDSEADRDRSLAAGFDAHLVKPTPIQTLVDVLTRGLERTRSETRAKVAPPAADARAEAAERKRGAR